MNYFVVTTNEERRLLQVVHLLRESGEHEVADTVSQGWRDRTQELREYAKLHGDQSLIFMARHLCAERVIVEMQRSTGQLGHYVRRC